MNILEYNIFKRPIPASFSKLIQAVEIPWIFKNIQAHKKLEVSRNSKLYFPAGIIVMNSSFINVCSWNKL